MTGSHITVAAVIEQEGRFLLVEELSGGRAVYNQPAGHVEPRENLLEAVVRETREETAWRVSTDRPLRDISMDQPGKSDHLSALLLYWNLP